MDTHLTNAGTEADRKLNVEDEAGADRLLHYLGVGQEKGMGVRQLAALANLTERKTKALVGYLRTEGVPICGTPPTGYFLPRTRTEAMSTLDSFASRYATTGACLMGISRGLDDLFAADALEATPAVA